jgi:hypothetical protein
MVVAASTVASPNNESQELFLGVSNYQEQIYIRLKLNSFHSGGIARPDRVCRSVSGPNGGA